MKDCEGWLILIIIGLFISCTALKQIENKIDKLDRRVEELTK